jgi:N utilization substance protein A
VCNALAPAEISRVIIDEANNSMEVIVPDEFLSIAIGKKGQNVRLASKLTGWHLDVKSETRYNQAMQTGYDSLVSLPGVGISLADALYESGFYSAEEIGNASIEDLTQIRGIGEEKAVKLLEAAMVTAAENSAAASDEETAEQTPEDEAAAETVAEDENAESATDDETAAETVAEDENAESATDDETAAETVAEDENAESATDDETAAETVAEDENAESATDDETAEPEDSPTPAQPSDEPESKED